MGTASIDCHSAARGAAGTATVRGRWRRLLAYSLTSVLSPNPSCSQETHSMFDVAGSIPGLEATGGASPMVICTVGANGEIVSTSAARNAAASDTLVTLRTPSAATLSQS